MLRAPCFVVCYPPPPLSTPLEKLKFGFAVDKERGTEKERKEFFLGKKGEDEGFCCTRLPEGEGGLTCSRKSRSFEGILALRQLLGWAVWILQINTFNDIHVTLPF